MISSASAHYRFGEFTLDLDREALVQNGQEIRLRPKCYQVLKVLVEHHGRLVTKEQLHEAVWAPAVVGDDSLAHCLIEIRRALGAAGGDMISTVPRRGYVFEPDIERLGPVLAFADAAHSRMFRPRFAAALLAVFGVLVIGILAMPPPRTVETILTDLGKTQALVAASPKIESEAYRHYQLGRFFYDRRASGDVDRAETAYRLAVDTDPYLAAAWMGLAAIYNIRIFDGSLPEEEAIYLLGEAAHRAVALDREDGEALARMATYLLRIGQTRLAEVHFARALALEPDNALLLSMIAGRLMHAGRLSEAITLQRRASALAPLSPVYSDNLVSMLRYAGRTAEALDELEKLQALRPSDVRSHASIKADLLVIAGRYDEAIRYALALEDIELRESRLAIIHQALGSRAKAQAAFERLESIQSDVSPYHIAEVLTWRGEIDKALDCLSRAGGPEHLRSLTAPDRQRINQKLLSPLLAPLRESRQWQELSDATQPDMPLQKTLTIAAKIM